MVTKLVSLVERLDEVRRGAEERRARDPAGYDAAVALYEAQKRQNELGEIWRRKADRLERSGVRLRDEVRNRLLDGELDQTEALSTVLTWRDDKSRRPWLVLSGRTGTGKSVSAATAIAVDGGLWIRADDVVRIFAGLFGDALERQARVEHARLLVLDDVGCEADKDRMQPALIELIDARVSAMWTPTIVTTNLTKRDFATRYDSERLMSRFSELVTWVALDGPDLRRKR